MNIVIHRPGTGSSPPSAPLRCYELQGLPFIPSYDDPGVYVSPGGKMVTEDSLVQQGAEMKVRVLWLRSWMKARL